MYNNYFYFLRCQVIKCGSFLQRISMFKCKTKCCHGTKITENAFNIQNFWSFVNPKTLWMEEVRKIKLWKRSTENPNIFVFLHLVNCDDFSYKDLNSRPSFSVSALNQWTCSGPQSGNSAKSKDHFENGGVYCCGVIFLSCIDRPAKYSTMWFTIQYHHYRLEHFS